MGKTSSKAYRRYGWLVGAFLGFGAPVGGLFLRSVAGGSLDHDWITQELRQHSFFYRYMVFATPIVFACFGYAIGVLLDKFSSQNILLKNTNLVLRDQSITDDMTGLHNHRHLVNLLEKEIERAKRYHSPLSTVMIDVDDFKKVNDCFGHLVGDQVLKELAHILKRNVRQVDTLARYGGDEFFIFLPMLTSETAELVAERIQASVRHHRFNEPNNLSLTVSVGISAFRDSDDCASLIKRTDQALLKAKSLGKNERAVHAA